MALVNAGTSTMPPKLAPVSATLKASPRRRTNQGARVALIAALLMVAQPTASSANAGCSCQGWSTCAIAATATNVALAPNAVEPRGPSRSSRGPLVMISTAPIQKYRVIANDTDVTGQPRATVRWAR